MTLLRKDRKVAFFFMMSCMVIALSAMFFRKTRDPLEPSVKPTIIEVDRRTMDLKTVFESEKAIASFTIYNKGDNPLQLSRVTTSCHCTTVDFVPKFVAPLDSAVIVVEYDKQNPGFFYQNIQVYGNFFESPIDLGIRGFVNR